MKPPRVTVGVISWNRFHYLRATLESAKLCIQYPNLEWIVIDNESNEPGLREYLEKSDWLDHVIYKRQTHADAMNQIVQMATGDYLVLWPEDVQFVVEGNWMSDLVEILENNKNIGSICLDHMRKVTLQRIFHPELTENWRLLFQEFKIFGRRFRRKSILSSADGFRIFTFGWLKPGICGSGIPSLTATKIWRELGPWRATHSTETPLIDSSLGAEVDMVGRFFQHGKPLQGAGLWIPVAADVITDPLGCKAKVRGKFRYGVYMPPPSGLFYYEISSLADHKLLQADQPIDFTTGVKPLGFEIPVDRNGDRLKHDFNDSVVFDINKNVEVRYPLDLLNESRTFVR